MPLVDERRGGISRMATTSYRAFCSAGGGMSLRMAASRLPCGAAIAQATVEDDAALSCRDGLPIAWGPEVELDPGEGAAGSDVVLGLAGFGMKPILRDEDGRDSARWFQRPSPRGSPRAVLLPLQGRR